MGVADVARAAPARATLCTLHSGRSTAGGSYYSTNCQRADEESGMTSTLTLSLRARNANRFKPRYQICLIHPFDPRGEKVGGLETYIRDFIAFHPADTDLLFIGVDSAGDLKLGEIHRLTFRGRTFDFLPILRYSDRQERAEDGRSTTPQTPQAVLT